ncbi:AsmA family protein [Pokkaliibacter sp. CJK22405]|uniref:AsmA family protein n=1 Tax=Pokkaliibacter sp. CJK22405 TaxID=3384615 RepID=UPI003984A807
MKVTRLVLWLLGALLGLAILCLIYLFTVFDPNDYRQRISAAIEDKTGLIVDIQGEMSWTLFPQFAITLNKVEAHYPDKPSLATLNNASVGLDVPALMGGQVSLSDLIVDGLTLNLQKETAGQNNWTRPSEETPVADESTGSGDSAGKSGSTQLAIDSVDLQNVQINYSDLTQNKSIAVGPVSLQASSISLGKRFPLSLTLPLSMSQEGGSQQSSQIALSNKLDADVMLDPDRQLYELSNLTLVSDIAGLSKQDLLLEAKGDVNLDLKQQRLSLPAMALQMNGIKAALSAEANQVMGDPSVSGKLSVEQANLRKWLADQGMAADFKSSDALTKVALQTPFSFKQNRIDLSDLVVTVDDTTLKGTLAYGLDSGRLSTVLKGDKINLDDYQSATEQPTEKQAESGSKQAGVASADNSSYSRAEVVPVEMLRSLNLDADITLNSVTYQQLALKNNRVMVQANGGKLTLDNLATQVSGGSISAKGSMDARKNPINSQVSFTASQVDLGQLQQLLGNDPSVTGQGTATGQLSMRGNSVYDWVNSLNGSMQADLAKGVLKNINVTHQLCQGIALANGDALGESTPSADTTLTDAHLQIRFNDGVAQVQQLNGGLVGATANGAGQIDLPQRRLDMLVKVIVQGDTSREACTINPKFQGLEWPLRCQGSLDGDPGKWCRPDKDGFANTIKGLAAREAERKAKKEVNKAIDKQTEKLKEKLGDDKAEAVKGLLQGILNK